MKRTLAGLLAAMIVSTGAVYAHGDSEHVRGTVKSVTDTSLVVQVSAKDTRTITVNEKTMVMKGEAHMALKDLKAGDRVVVDVDKKTKLATEVKVGAAPAATAKKTTSTKSKG